MVLNLGGLLAESEMTCTHLIAKEVITSTETERRRNRRTKIGQTDADKADKQTDK